MQLPVLNFSTMLEQMAAGVQGAAAQLIDLSVGSVLRAMLEACAALALWLQWLILQVLTATRAATSQGADLDSWMADFSFVRLPGSHSTGLVTFSRYTTGLAVTIAVGTNVLTTDGTQTFTVIADPTNPAWSNGAYSLPASIASVNLPVAAIVVGAAGNVLAGAIGLIASPVPGVDMVNNASALAGGTDAESDAALRTRFQLYINSRSLATVGAVESAIANIAGVFRYAVMENQDAQGNLLAGAFRVVADDGSGAPGAALLGEVQSAVDAVRPIGATFSVTGPSIIEASIVVAIETSNPTTHTAVAANVQAAIVAWVASLPIQGTLAISKIDALAHGVDASVVSVTSTLVNGAAVDLTAPPGGVILAQTVSVS
jgi:uncharacterized phage protein gp47/JayE